ncbi:DUF4097 family beta strand repeat-containing protein [Pseudonocardia sp. TRM90224]|uniref:DUF4097 family beta strand repeat-containing protein n=1 Tax=Pseudonocardia sp. TRM90224 TaxID=2812678 RepID=UPI001E315EA1|nr:DUF4097 family beta strand repeat-containing protein [Pseudonocardia sp. TRM90224]
MYSFETPEPIAVTLDLPNSSVRIIASKRSDTRVTVLNTDTDDNNVHVDFLNGQLLIKGTPHRGLGWALDLIRGSKAQDVEIELPAGSRFGGKVSAGDLRCEGPLGECRFFTKYGNIRFDEGGPVQLATTYGDVEVDRAHGHAELSTGFGEMRAHHVDGTAEIRNNYGDSRIGEVAGDLDVEGLYGEIRVDRAGAGVVARTAYGSVRIKEVVRGVVDLSTTSGELEIGIKAGTAAWLDVSSTTGKVRNSLDGHSGPDGFAETVEIRASTSGGDILIHRA